MESQTLDLSKLSAAELKAELTRREQAEKKAAEQAKDSYLADKDEFAKHTAAKFQQLNNELSELKAFTIAEANKLYERMYEVAGKEPKETKSFSLKNESDTIKIVVDRQDRFEFTDEAMVHINAIRDIFKDKFEGRNKGMYNILDGLLIKNSKNEYDPKLLAKARRQVRELGDEALIEEFDALDECQRITGTAQYTRVYVKKSTGKWQEVSLNFSSL